MSGGWLHGGVPDWGRSKCRAAEEAPLLPSCITFGVSTSGGGETPLNSLEAGVEAPSTAGPPQLCVTWADGVSGRSKHLLVDAAPSENLCTFLFLIEAVCLFGVTLDTVLVFWRDPLGWFPTSDATAHSVAFFACVLFGLWDWSLDLVWNVNEGNLHTLPFLDSWLTLSRTLVADWHFLLPRLTGGMGTELSNCGLTWKKNMKKKKAEKSISWIKTGVTQNKFLSMKGLYNAVSCTRSDLFNTFSDTALTLRVGSVLEWQRSE